MGVTSMEKERELVPSLSPAKNATAWVPVWDSAGVQAKDAISGAAPVAPAKTAPAGRSSAQSRTVSSLGSVAVTCNCKGELCSVSTLFVSGEKRSTGGSGSAPP